MQFLKAGEPAESNIFNRLDERKRVELLKVEEFPIEVKMEKVVDIILRGESV